MIDDDLEIWIVPISAITAHWNPFHAWMHAPVEPHEALQAFQASRVASEPYDALTDAAGGFTATRDYHIQRIAWFLANPDPNPIEIDIGMPSYGHYPRNGVFDFLDGNHRLCAAIIRGDSEIAVIFGGECDLFPQIFPQARMLQRASAPA